MSNGDVVCRALQGALVSTLAIAVGIVGTARASADSCGNAQFRVGHSARLPDCRAYELVTPSRSASPIAPLYLTSVAGADELPEAPPQVQASILGDRIAYGSEESSPQSPGVVDLATRGPDGWSTEGVIPRLATERALCLDGVTMADWSPGLSESVLTWGDEAPDCALDEPELVAGEPRGVGNLFVRDTQAGSYRLVDVTPAGVVPPERGALYDGGSADLSVVAFDEEAQLTADAPLGDDLYAWSGGSVHLVTVLPGGADVATVGKLAGAERNESGRHAVSADGSRIFFQANGNLYVRENGGQAPIGECAAEGSPCTVQVDLSQGGSGSSGGGTFLWASADGSKVFFTDESRLTEDSTAQAGTPDLYEYDVNHETGKPGTLIDLTVSAGEPAEVMGVSGVSEDGSYVYFVADGVLTGAEENSKHAKASAGEPNLYVRHEGTTRFIATLNGASTDVCDWDRPCLTSRVSANGRFLAFDSVQSLTGYDNTPALPEGCEFNGPSSRRQPGQPCVEIFRYDAGSGRLDCVSCIPDGSRPVASTTIRTPALTLAVFQGRHYLTHNVSDAGQVFFDSADRLVQAAANGLRNVYEFDDSGLHLISSGTAEAESFFYDATPDGSDVFFITEQALVPVDTSAKYAIYDARVGGGFAYPSQRESCEGETCKGGPATTPTFGVPGSVSFVGSGNPHRAVRAGAKRKKLSRKKRLARALKGCRRREKGRKRVLCERKARKRYGAIAPTVQRRHRRSSR